MADVSSNPTPSHPRREAPTLGEPHVDPPGTLILEGLKPPAIPHDVGVDLPDDFQEREVIVDRSVDQSIDISPPPKKSALERAKLERPFRGTALGDQVFRSVELLLGSRVRPQEAFADLANARLGRRLNRLLMDISERLEGGALVSEACSEHRQVFGDLLLEFVRMGEQGYALRDSLVKYRELRDGLDQISGTYRIEGYIRVPPLFNYTTRAFALTFGTVLEMSDDVKRSVRCAAFECRPGIRKRLAESLALIRAGESIGDVLPERSFWRSGFEAGFIDLIRNADEQSRLTKTLLACSRM